LSPVFDTQGNIVRTSCPKELPNLQPYAPTEPLSKLPITSFMNSSFLLIDRETKSRRTGNKSAIPPRTPPSKTYKSGTSLWCDASKELHKKYWEWACERNRVSAYGCQDKRKKMIRYANPRQQMK
jgi:hypothetical protein